MTYISLQTCILVASFCLGFGFLSGAAWVAMRSNSEDDNDPR